MVFPRDAQCVGVSQAVGFGNAGMLKSFTVMAAWRCGVILMGGACFGVWRLGLFPTNHLDETHLFIKADLKKKKKNLSFAKYIDK